MKKLIFCFRNGDFDDEGSIIRLSQKGVAQIKSASDIVRSMVKKEDLNKNKTLVAYASNFDLAQTSAEKFQEFFGDGKIIADDRKISGKDEKELSLATAKYFLEKSETTDVFVYFSSSYGINLVPQSLSTLKGWNSIPTDSVFGRNYSRNKYGFKAVLSETVPKIY